MLSVHLPYECQENASFYLAMEEYLARFTNKEYFFMWQVSPSVIMGRNQLMANEINVDFCRKNRIKIFRRKSGGGCVYADEGNVMLSYVGTGDNVQYSFRHYVAMVVKALADLGIPFVESSGRNDIMLNGRKISGNAFYHIQDRNIVHGTLLYDTNMTNMVNSITPDNQKLETKGIRSVNQRIGLLKDYYNGNLSSLKLFLEKHLTCDRIVLQPHEIDTIREIEKEYLSDEFLYGHDPLYSISKHFYKKGCGSLSLKISIKDCRIKKVEIAGDFMELGDINRFLLQPLTNISYTKTSIQEVYKDIDVSQYIMNLSNDEFVNLLVPE